MPEEMFDVIDDDNHVIGQERRSVVHQTGLQHRGVHMFLFTSDGKLLVQQRSKDRKNSPSSLDCSVSEHVRAGEEYLAGAMRGLKEELGLEALELRPIITFRMKYGPNDNEISRVYQGHVDPALVQFDPVELEYVEYYSLQELAELLDGGKKPFSYWFRQLLLWSIDWPSDLQILAVHSPLQPDAYLK
jgi:isopentenyl-diphosphate Delta-isomerase